MIEKNSYKSTGIRHSPSISKYRKYIYTYAFNLNIKKLINTNTLY